MVPILNDLVLAEASGSRTHRRHDVPHAGFEDQAQHRPRLASSVILTSPTSITTLARIFHPAPQHLPAIQPSAVAQRMLHSKPITHKGFPQPWLRFLKFRNLPPTNTASPSTPRHRLRFFDSLAKPAPPPPSHPGSTSIPMTLHGFMPKMASFFQLPDPPPTSCLPPPVIK